MAGVIGPSSLSIKTVSGAAGAAVGVSVAGTVVGAATGAAVAAGAAVEIELANVEKANLVPEF